MQNNSGRKSTHADTEGKREEKSKPHLMQVASYVCGCLVIILGIAAGIFLSVGQRDVGLWTSCVAMILVIVGGCCWYQDLLWSKDEREPTGEQAAQSAAAASESSDRARISIEDFKLIFSQDGKTFTYQLIIHNYGKRPAHIYAQSFNYITNGGEDILLDKPTYWPPEPFASVIHPEQRFKVLDDKWFPRVPEEANIICCWGFIKYLSEGYETERVLGYGFRWQNGRETTLIRKPGYNYDQ